MKLGIDLGTCFSFTAGVIGTGGLIFLVSHSQSNYKDIYDENNQGIPTVLYNDSENKKVKGMKALKLMSKNPENGVQYIKKDLLEFSKGIKSNQKSISDFETSEISLGGTKFTIKEIICEFIKFLIENSKAELKNSVYRNENSEIENIVIAVPAAANDFFRNYIIECTAEASGLAEDKIKCIDEPIAAALSYFDKEKHIINTKNRILICDLGGGTFDAAIVEHDPNRTESYKIVKCQGGLEKGGNNWDEALEYYILGNQSIEQYISSNDFFIHATDEVINTFKFKFRREIIKTKMDLSNKDNMDDKKIVFYYCQFFHNNVGEEKEIEVKKSITRIEFENIQKVKDLCEEITRNIEKLINTYQSECPDSKISNVILAGGGSNMPMIEKSIKENIINKYYETENIPIAYLPDPDKAIALGAAIYAGNQNEFIGVAPYSCDLLIVEDKKIEFFGLIGNNAPMEKHDDGIYIEEPRTYIFDTDTTNNLTYILYNRLQENDYFMDEKKNFISDKYYRIKRTITSEETGMGKHEINFELKLIQGRPLNDENFKVSRRRKTK